MATTKLGSVGYFPTQIIYDESYSHKTDVWGLGCVFFQLLTGFPPFVGSANNNDQTTQVMAQMDEGFYYFPKTVQVSVSCLEVLSKMLQD